MNIKVPMWSIYREVEINKFFRLVFDIFIFCTSPILIQYRKVCVLRSRVPRRRFPMKFMARMFRAGGLATYKYVHMNLKEILQAAQFGLTSFVCPEIRIFRS